MVCHFDWINFVISFEANKDLTNVKNSYELKVDQKPEGLILQ